MSAKESRHAAWGWAILLGLLAIAVKRGSFVASDHQVAQWMQAIRTPTLDTAARLMTFFGSAPWIVLLTVGMGAYWMIQRQGQALQAFVVAGVLGLVIQVGLRLWVAQWRPDVSALPPSMDLINRCEMAGFTSGHGFRSAFLYGWWSQALVHRGTRWGTVGAMGCWVMILLVGLTRVYLLRHWLTDLVGAWLVALVVLSVAASLRTQGRFASS